MKILSPSEIKQANETERVKDITRTETTRKALDKVQRELNESNARFELALANQRIRWAKEEEEATKKITDLHSEIDLLKKTIDEANIPIEEEKKKAHDLFVIGEALVADAKKSLKVVEEKRQHYEGLANTLQKRLDDLYEKESCVEIREQKVTIRENAVTMEREQIKKLSQELSIKLTHL